MAEQFPNKIPMYVSGDAGKPYGSQITSQQTDPDGSDAISIYTCNGTFNGHELNRVLLRKITVYARGSSNGAGRMLVWKYINNSGTYDCIGEVSWTAPTARGKIAEFQFADYDPSLSEQLRGEMLYQNDEIWVQFEDALISDGYRVFTHARDLSYFENWRNAS